MEARQHHFFFAKQLLPTHTFRSPDKVFAELKGPKREAFLMFLWQEAGKGMSPVLPPADVGQVPGGTNQDVIKLSVIGALTKEGKEVIVLSMPPALASNEAVFIALVRDQGEPRVFFYERCLGQTGGVAENEAVLAEAKPNGRMNYGFHQGLGLSSFKEHLGKLLGISLEGIENSLPPITMADFVGKPMGGPAIGPAMYASAGAGAQGATNELGTILEKLLLVRAAMPPFFWVVGFVLGGLVGILARVLNPLVSLAIGVLLLIWLHRLYTARQAQLSWSPGMAVGAWFIPVANFILPALVIRDAWKAVRGPEGSGVVFLWWLFWLLEIGLRTMYALGMTMSREVGNRSEALMHIGPATFPVPSVLMSVMPFASLIIALGAYGLLWHIVHQINEKA